MCSFPLLQLVMGPPVGLQGCYCSSDAVWKANLGDGRDGRDAMDSLPYVSRPYTSIA